MHQNLLAGRLDSYTSGTCTNSSLYRSFDENTTNLSGSFDWHPPRLARVGQNVKCLSASVVNAVRPIPPDLNRRAMCPRVCGQVAEDPPHLRLVTQLEQHRLWPQHRGNVQQPGVKDVLVLPPVWHRYALPGNERELRLVLSHGVAQLPVAIVPYALRDVWRVRDNDVPAHCCQRFEVGVVEHVYP